MIFYVIVVEEPAFSEFDKQQLLILTYARFRGFYLEHEYSLI